MEFPIHFLFTGGLGVLLSRDKSKLQALHISDRHIPSNQIIFPSICV